MRSAVTRILPAAGIAAGLAWAGAVIYCGAVRQGYDPVNQFISELAERGSSTETVMRVCGYYVPGLLILAFAVFLLIRSTGWAAPSPGCAAARPCSWSPPHWRRPCPRPAGTSSYWCTG